MNKEILFSYNSVSDRFRAECAVVGDGVLWGDWKFLTQQEIDGLSDLVNFDEVLAVPDSLHRYPVEQLAPAFESTDLDDTHFETMYNKFIKE